MTLKNEKYNAIPIMILYLFTLVLIKVIVLNNFNYFYFVTLISGLFILYRIGIIVKMKGFLDRNRDLKYFYYIASIYVIYVLILTLVKMPSGIVYSVNIVIPFITMLFLIYDFVNSDYIIEKLNKFIFYIFLITSIAAIVMVVLGYSKIDLSFEYGIYLTPTKTYLMWDHEIRLSWLTSHKSRYALYCLIGIFFVNYNKFINKKMKVFTIVLLYINLILSSSITSIAIGGLALIFILKDIILNLFSRFRWLKILTIIGVPVIGIVSIWIVSMKRNIKDYFSANFAGDYDLELEKGKRVCLYYATSGNGISSNVIGMDMDSEEIKEAINKSKDCIFLSISVDDFSE